MAKEEISPVHGPSADARIHETQKAHAKQQLSNMVAVQVESQEDFKTIADQALFSPMRMQKKFEKLEDKVKRPTREEAGAKTEAKKEAGQVETSETEEIAQHYFERNPELQKKTLLILQQRIKNDDSADEILTKLQETFTDKSLADEAIDFLIDTARGREEMRNKLLMAKERFNAAYGREIRAGRNIASQAREFSRAGLGSPTALRDLYRDITSAPRDAHQLFEELTEKFEFSKMKNIIDFILHSLGADLKAKGSSISHAELQRLFSEARSMQAILGIFRFFYARMGLVKKEFERQDLVLPSRITFELLARLLMKLLQERYPSPDKVLKLAFILGIAEEVAAQIIIFTQYRDAMRHISPKFFKSERHRQDLLMTIMEALSDLEDEFEEEEEEGENPQPPKKKPKDTLE